MQLETAIGMWRLLFAEHSWVLLDDWCDFLLKNHKRAVSRDTWVQLLDFCKVRPCTAALAPGSIQQSIIKYKVRKVPNVFMHPRVALCAQRVDL